MNQTLFLCISAFFVIAALVAAEAEEMLGSLIALSTFGILLAIVFAVLQAPDVALTQAIVNSGLVTSIFLVAYSQTSKEKNATPLRDDEEERYDP